LTPRVQIGSVCVSAAAELDGLIQEAANKLRYINLVDINADMMTKHDATEILKEIKGFAAESRQDLVKIKRELDNLMFNIDWFITVCSKEIKNVENRVEGRQT
jgi:hypothetical protein